MSAAPLLERLHHVRATGPSRWVATCPSHDDKSPSLAVREMDDGTVLIKCFAGCAATDVVAAAGLAFKDLFPLRPVEHARKPSRGWLDARDVLACLATEGQILAIAANDWLSGSPFSQEDTDRIARAAGRIRSAWGVFNGSR